MHTNEIRLEAAGGALAASLRTQMVAARHETFAQRLKSKYESAILIANLLPVDRAKADEVYRGLREADEKRLKNGRLASSPPTTFEAGAGRSAPYDLVWQTDVAPGGSFYGPDSANGLVGSKVSADMGHSASMGNCVGFRYYAQEDARVRFRANVVQIHGWALASGVFGSAEVQGSCTIQVQEEDGGADIGSSRQYFVYAAAGPFIRDEKSFSDETCTPSVDVSTRRGQWYQVWSAMDSVLASGGAAYAGIDCQGFVARFSWDYL